MMKPWHRSNQAYFEKEKSEVEREFPRLQFRLCNEFVILEGEFPLFAEGKIRDRYFVEITLARDHPKALPVVREIAGRIPRKLERHINSDGTACILLPDERWKCWPVGAPLINFLNGPLRSYLICQSLVEAGDAWPMEQLGHGAEGILASYGDLLGTKDAEIIRGYIVCLAARMVKGHHWCPCKSGRRLRDCHLRQILELREKISTVDAAKSLSFLHG